MYMLIMHSTEGSCHRRPVRLIINPERAEPEVDENPAFASYFFFLAKVSMRRAAKSRSADKFTLLM